MKENKVKENMVKENKLSYEDALRELEKIVCDMEEGELPLDSALEIYKRGVELIRYCNGKLDEAEKKITMLLENADGSVTEQKFGGVEE